MWKSIDNNTHDFNCLGFLFVYKATQKGKTQKYTFLMYTRNNTFGCPLGFQLKCLRKLVKMYKSLCMFNMQMFAPLEPSEFYDYTREVSWLPFPGFGAIRMINMMQGTHIV